MKRENIEKPSVTLIVPVYNVEHYGIIYYRIAADVCGLCLRELDASSFLFYFLANLHLFRPCYIST